VDVYTIALVDAKMGQVLKRFDDELAEQVHEEGCPCGGPLHHADYPRKPRGVAAEAEGLFDMRTSFCCGREGCRHRRTPESTRFLGRKVYVGAVVVLVTVLRHGPNRERMERLRAVFGMCARTVARWRKWWQGAFARSSFWRGARGLIMPPVSEADLPASLLERFAGDGADRLCAVLRFVSPVTTSSRGARTA
jgi:hypothetical protein